jgi:hypothetical protein
MFAIFVNDVEREIEAVPVTWGDLLDRLDAEAARDGVVLSAARFDGVEEPSFREPALAARLLSGLTRIDVEMAVPGDLLHDCLAAAIQTLDDAACRAVDLSAEYRQLDVSAGHAGLVELCTALREMATLVGVLDGRLGVDISHAGRDGVTAERHLETLDAVLQSVVAAQESSDWLTVADILEYDLEPLIRQWAELFRALSRGGR